MKKIEKIKKYYTEMGIKVDDTYIEGMSKDRKKDIIRLYKQEEIKSMNYILGKPEDNLIFTKFQLQLMGTINLVNKKIVEICKVIYEKEILRGDVNGRNLEEN